jgi:large subunit ribosomal protein L21
MQFGVFKTGGKQYKAFVGGFVSIEKLPGDYKKGDTITFDEVLLLDDGAKTDIGTPTLSGKKIEAEIAVIGREKKIDVIKYRAKSNYYKKRGHRQPFFKVKITKIA